MAINKNFVVKNGLEVNTQLLYADGTTNKVGIASTAPTVELDVRVVLLLLIPMYLVLVLLFRDLELVMEVVYFLLLMLRREVQLVSALHPQVFF